MRRVHEEVTRAVACINDRIANKEFDERFNAFFRPKFSLRWYELFRRYRDTGKMSGKQFSARVISIREWFSVFVPLTLHETTMARELVWQWLDVEQQVDRSSTSSTTERMAADRQADIELQEDLRNSKPLREWMQLCTCFYDSFAVRGTLYSFELVFVLLACMEADGSVPER
jgi:hypothetical protein